MPFSTWTDAGFDLDALLPVLPPDAVISASSEILPAHRGKVPGLCGNNGWYGFNWRAGSLAAQDRDRAEANGCNIGLKAGTYPGLDIDILDEDLAAEVEALGRQVFGPAPQRIGRYPKRLLMYAASGLMPKHKVRFTIDGMDKVHVVELLAEGQQYVIEGIHPETRAPYTWDDPPIADLLTPIGPDQVAEFFQAVRELLENRFDVTLTSHDSLLPGEEVVAPETLDAPSEAELIRAVSLWPNTSARYTSREDYIMVAYAIRAAGRQFPETAEQCWQDWCAKWEDGTNDPDVAASDWSRCKPPHRLGWDYIRRELRHFGIVPPGDAVAPVAEAIQHAPFAAPLPADLDPSKLPVRPWVLGRRFLRGAVTAGVGAPGVSKSTMSLLSALAIATGRHDLTGEHVYTPGRVWVHNNEDDETELYRRIGGLLKHYGIPTADVSRKMFVSSGATKRLCVAIRTADKVMFSEAVAELVAQIRANEVVYMSVDPFVSTHDGIDENSNADMEKVIGAFRHIASETNCAIDLVHHAVKSHSGNTESRAGDMNAARGAGAVIGAARSSYTLSPMSEKTADTLGIEPEDSWRYVRLDSAKENYAPKNRAPKWFELISVSLENGGDAFDAESDSVGVPVARPHLEEELRAGAEAKQREKQANATRDLLQTVAVTLAVGTPCRLGRVAEDVAVITGIKIATLRKSLAELFYEGSPPIDVVTPDGSNVRIASLKSGRFIDVIKSINV